MTHRIARKSLLSVELLDDRIVPSPVVHGLKAHPKAAHVSHQKAAAAARAEKAGAAAQSAAAQLHGGISSAAVSASPTAPTGPFYYSPVQGGQGIFYVAPSAVPTGPTPTTLPPVPAPGTDPSPLPPVPATVPEGPPTAPFYYSSTNGGQTVAR